MRETFGRARHCGDVFADRVTHGLRDDTGIKTAREGLQHNPGKTRQKTVCEAGRRVLLVNDERPTGEPGSEAARPGYEAAHAENGNGTAAQDDAERLQECPRQLKWCDQQRGDALAAQPLDADPFDVDARSGDNPRFESAVGAEPHDVLRTCPQCVRNGECRVHVATRSSRHHEYRPPAHRLLLRLRLTGLASTTSSW